MFGQIWTANIYAHVYNEWAVHKTILQNKTHNILLSVWAHSLVQKKLQPENWKRQNSSSWFPRPAPPCWVELVLNLAAIHFLPSGINSCIQFKSWNQEYGTMPRFLFCFAETDFGDNGQSIAMEKGKVDAARAFNVFSWLQKLKRTTDPT